MHDDRRRRITGIALIVVGVLFLMVSNDVLLGWEHIWPLFPLAAGAALLRAHRRRPAPWLVFTGVTAALLGFFFFFFSTGILSWDRMAALWPMFPAIAGLALIAEALAGRDGSPSIIIGSTIVLFAAVGFLLESGTVNSRVATPFVRFWPLALILAGVVLLKTSPRHKTDPDMELVREVLADAEAEVPQEGDIPPGLQGAILDRVRAAGSPDDAVGALVQGLKANFTKMSWVGMYRLSADTLTLGDGDYVGSSPEYRDVRMDEGICGAAATERRTIVVPDVARDARYLASNPSAKSEIVVPVISGGGVIGALVVDSDTPDAFTSDDRRFLESLAEKAAPFLRVGLPSS